MHKSRLNGIIIDCKEPTDMVKMAEFWAGALGLRIAIDETEDKYVALVGPADEVQVAIQRVEHESRVHLDIETDDQEAEARRLIALGARPVGKIKDWQVLEAPSGHRFCLVKPGREGFTEKANRWDSDQGAAGN